MTDLKIGCRYIMEGILSLDGEELYGPEVIFWATQKNYKGDPMLLVEVVNRRPVWIPEAFDDGHPALSEHPGS